MTRLFISLFSISQRKQELQFKIPSLLEARIFMFVFIDEVLSGPNSSPKCGNVEHVLSGISY